MTMTEGAANVVKTVLIADDEEAIRSLLSLALEAEGFDVLHAQDGVEAIEIAEEHRPDLVVMDMMMPRMGGLNALAHLRRRPSTADLPVVLLTARSSDDDILEGWRAGADYYLTKPFDLGALLRFVEYLVAERRMGRTAEAV